MQITTPSGLAGEARRFKGHDLKAIADSLEDDEQIGAGSLNAIVRGSWTLTSSSGPYPFQSDQTSALQVNRLYKADVTSILLKLRVGSFRGGNIYGFAFQCEKCNKRTEDWEIDIVKELLSKEKPFPEKTLASFQSGGPPLEKKLDDGTLVCFRMTTPDDEIPYGKLRKQQIARKERKTQKLTLIDIVAPHIVSVNGKGFNSDPRRTWQWVCGLDGQDILDIRDAINDADGGIDTTIRVQCAESACRWPQDIELPLVRSFLDPSSRTSRLAKDPDRMPTPENTDETTTTDPIAGDEAHTGV